MSTFKLWWIEFENIIYKDIYLLSKDINNIMQDNIIIMANIFTFDYNSDIEYISTIIPTNILYSKEDNWTNIHLLLIKKSQLYNYEKIDNLWFYIYNDFLKFIVLNWLKSSSKNFITQTEDIYNNLFSIIKTYWFTTKNIFRAWNFINDVLINYKDFNKVRDHYFNLEWINDNYPAWTGIDCLLNNNFLHSAWYMLLKSDSIIIETLNDTQLQCHAELYWPKFSRAKVLKSEVDWNDILFISWTAAVNLKWESIFTDDIEKNILFTLESIFVLLEKVNMSFDDIQVSYLYLKNKNFSEVFNKIYIEKKYKFNFIETYCDICRDDFLFEMECIAVNKY